MYDGFHKRSQHGDAWPTTLQIMTVDGWQKLHIERKGRSEPFNDGLGVICWSR